MAENLVNARGYIEIVLKNIGKRFKLDWIFRQLDYTFEAKQQYAILGPNGSGKSTLMKILSGHLTPSQGSISFQSVALSINIEKDSVYRYISYAAPYIELIEELTLWEALQFHQKFKPFLPPLQPTDLLDLLHFSKSKNKEIRFFSSGMKQRLKLVLAICSNTPILLLDEPTTNLDRQGMDWYLGLMEQFMGERLVIVASNVEEDYSFCKHHINILDYKLVVSQSGMEKV